MAAIAVAGLLALAAVALWWALRPALPEQPAEQLVAGNPALDLPSQPVGVVVLAQPAAWARLLARDPARRLLLDPAWWDALQETGRRGPSAGALAPAAVAAGVLSQFPEGLTGAWWQDGWVIQGRVRGGAVAEELRRGGLLPDGMEERTVVHGGILRVASSKALLEGWGWRPPATVPPEASLACWGWVSGAEWRGRWRGGMRLEIARGEVSAPPGLELGGAAAMGAADGLAALARLGVRLPESGLVGAITRELGRALARPVTAWVREVAAGQPLPRPRGALLLGWRDDEPPGPARDAAVERIRNALCPLGCRETGPAAGGNPRRWQSPLLSWWVRVDERGVLLATGEAELEAAAGRLAAVSASAGWLAARGPEAAHAADVLGSASLLADIGLVPRGRLELLRRASGPLAGFREVAWAEGAGGAAAWVDFAAPETDGSSDGSTRQ